MRLGIGEGGRPIYCRPCLTTLFAGDTHIVEVESGPKSLPGLAGRRLIEGELARTGSSVRLVGVDGRTKGATDDKTGVDSAVD